MTLKMEILYSANVSLLGMGPHVVKNPDADSEDGKGPKNEVPAASYSPRPSFVSILADILCDFI